MGSAVTLFLARGYAGTSMADLAEACGIQKASLYHHFASKDALFVACVTEGYEEGTQCLLAIRDAELKPAAKVSAADCRGRHADARCGGDLLHRVHAPPA